MIKIKLCDFLSLMVDNYLKISIEVFEDRTITNRYVFPAHTMDYTDISEEVWQSDIYLWAVYYDIISITIKKG